MTLEEARLWLATAVCSGHSDGCMCHRCLVARPIVSAQGDIWSQINHLVDPSKASLDFTRGWRFATRMYASQKEGQEVVDALKMRPMRGDLLVIWCEHEHVTRISNLVEPAFADAGATALILPKGTRVEDLTHKKAKALLGSHHKVTNEINTLVAVAEVIETSIISDNPEEIGQSEKRTLELLGPSPAKGLALLALNDDFAADVRGVAARMFSGHADWNDPLICSLAATLASSSQTLVKVGFLLGLEDTQVTWSAQ